MSLGKSCSCGLVYPASYHVLDGGRRGPTAVVDAPVGHPPEDETRLVTEARPVANPQEKGSDMLKSAHLVRVLALGLTLGGCATILGGTSQLLTVNANVDGAEVYLNETLLGTTPLAATIKRGQTGVLRVTAEGYTPYQIALNNKDQHFVLGQHPVWRELRLYHGLHHGRHVRVRAVDLHGQPAAGRAVD